MTVASLICKSGVDLPFPLVVALDWSLGPALEDAGLLALTGVVLRSADEVRCRSRRLFLAVAVSGSSGASFSSFFTFFLDLEVLEEGGVTDRFPSNGAYGTSADVSTSISSSSLGIGEFLNGDRASSIVMLPTPDNKSSSEGVVIDEAARAASSSTSSEC